MKWVVALVVLFFASVACVQIVDDSRNETVYKSEVVQSIKAYKTVQKTAEVITAPPEEIILNETNYSNSVTGSIVEDEVFEDLSIGAAHKLIPELEAVVKSAYCYNLTWNGLSEQKLPLEVRKEIRFNYMGGRLFKGWIMSRLMLNNNLVDAQTVEVLVEFMQVTCLDTENFTVDLDAKLRRFVQ